MMSILLYCQSHHSYILKYLAKIKRRCLLRLSFSILGFVIMLILKFRPQIEFIIYKSSNGNKGLRLLL